ELGLWADEEDVAKIARALEGADGYRDLELKVVRKDGTVIDVLGSASLISWGGEPVRLKMFVDNTASKRAQEQVSRAIKDVMAEAAWFSRNIVERLSRAGEPNRRSEPTPELTPREQQVLARIALGMTDKAIAEELGVSRQTVRNHVARIYGKIKVHSRSQAVVWAREKGIPGSAIAPT
ncbi:MAG TPA: LuxR C-terminal-related transcriptional regulator, partial [Trueperaceae bacterium]|nr:LuxR C-terminal-related transcriptional regulator [Trueperaceae bacterium]